MSTVNANVTAAQEFTPDSEGKALLTIEDLNRLGTPTVTLTLDDSVDAEDIKDEAVSAAKLDDTVRAAILAATATVSAEAANVVTVTVQVKTIDGVALSGQKALVEWWISAASGEAVASTPPDSIAYGTGKLVKEFTALLHGIALTDSAGVLIMTFTKSGALGPLYFNAVVQGRWVVGNRTMDWGAP